MTDGELTAAQIAALTASVDIDAPPPDTGPSALVLFGTNQAAPARIAAGRYHRGLAPLIIATGVATTAALEASKRLAADGVRSRSARDLCLGWRQRLIPVHAGSHQYTVKSAVSWPVVPLTSSVSVRLGISK